MQIEDIQNVYCVLHDTSVCVCVYVCAVISSVFSSRFFFFFFLVVSYFFAIFRHWYPLHPATAWAIKGMAGYENGFHIFKKNYLLILMTQLYQSYVTKPAKSPCLFRV